MLNHDGHEAGMLQDFSEHGKIGIIREFHATSGKNCNKFLFVIQIFV